MKRRNRPPRFLFTFSLFFLLLLALIVIIPIAAENTFGPAASDLSPWRRFHFSYRLLINHSELTSPYDPLGTEMTFSIEAGESAQAVSTRLEEAGLIPDAEIFGTYLSWTGMDAFIQVGTFRLSPALSPVSIAGMLQSSTLTDVRLTILPGWRMEEIAAALPSVGLSISFEDFIQAVYDPPIMPEAEYASLPAEGFLYPGTYSVPRSLDASRLVQTLVQGFMDNLPVDYPDLYSSEGLSLYQAVILASIVEREAIMDDEMPLIASVFYNRLAIGMKLQADPTVQYALGYNVTQGTWWTTPLSVSDLQFDSPFNTYVYPSLPPGPISNPGLAALTSVAYPAETTFFYFQARCDGSGLHVFVETFEQHEQNYCP